MRRAQIPTAVRSTACPSGPPPAVRSASQVGNSSLLNPPDEVPPVLVAADLTQGSIREVCGGERLHGVRYLHDRRSATNESGDVLGPYLHGGGLEGGRAVLAECD